ncbi:MAG TPA: protein kinase [Polyangiaceae bacterium]
MRLNPGDLIGGKYRISRLIGDGGMGAVYEARHEVLGSKVALKFLHSDLTKKPGLASRFLQEAKVSASIQSPHVTRVTDVDTASDGAPYLVMELLSGESLQRVLDRQSKLPRDQAIDFALQVLSGLESAHALGVVHRDLKPDNVYVTPSSGGPVLKLLDFGIAKLKESNEFQRGLTRPGALMGTPEYMAPEQLYAAERVDHRADLYSLGAMLYEMLTGQRPAYGEDAAQIIGQVAAGRIKPITDYDPTLPATLVDVVRRALAPDKAQRFQSAFEMRVALARCAGQLSHAGRLAAEPAPVEGGVAEQVAAAGTPPTVDAPPLAPQATHAHWSQHQPGAEPAKGGTQEAPKELIQELTRPGAHAPAAGHGRAPDAGGFYGPPPTHAQPGAGAGQYVPALGPTPYGTNAASRYGARRPNRMLGAILALILGVIVTGAVVVALALSRREPDEPIAAAEGASAPTSEPTTVVTAEAPPPTPPAPVAPAIPEPAQPTTSPRPTKPRPNAPDAGAGTPDAGGVLPFPQIQLPSGFPPLPSSLPPLPSGFPQIPGLPFPTEQPGTGGAPSG